MNNLPKSPRVELIDCFQPVLAIRPLNEKQITDRKCTKVTNNGIAKGNSRNSNRATIIATNNTDINNSIGLPQFFSMATTMTEHNNNNPFGVASFDSDLDDSDLSSITGGSPSTNDLDDSPNIIATEISLPNSQATYISDDEETTGWDSSDSIKGESNINELLKVAESIQCGISIGDVSKNYDGYESEDFYQEEDNENNCGFEFAHLYADLDTDAVDAKVQDDSAQFDDREISENGYNVETATQSNNVYDPKVLEYSCDRDHSPCPSDVSSDDSMVDWNTMKSKIMSKTEDNNPESASQNVNKYGKFVKSVHIFSDVCLKFVEDKCYKICCEFSHQLPSVYVVLANLERASADDVAAAYKELLIQYDLLTTKYFPVFCKFYGQKKIREQLRRMIPIAAESSAKHGLLKEIVSGLVTSGVPYHMAIDLLLDETEENLEDRVKQPEIVSQQFEMMWQLFVDERNEVCLFKHLQHFEAAFMDDNIQSNSKAISKLLTLTPTIDNTELREFFCKILSKCPLAVFRKIDAVPLHKYLRSVEVFGTNEYLRSIDQKLKINVQI